MIFSRHACGEVWQRQLAGDQKLALTIFAIHSKCGKRPLAHEQAIHTVLHKDIGTDTHNACKFVAICAET